MAKRNYNNTPISISNYFNIDPIKLDAENALDSVLNMDTELFINPLLLSSSKSKEMKNTREEFLKHFRSVLDKINIYNKATAAQGQLFETIKKDMSFPEPKGFCLGYGKSGKRGKGIGKSNAKVIAELAIEMVSIGIDDPVAFELISIFQGGVGCDLLSDMTSRILYSDFMRFSERVFDHLEIKDRFAVHHKGEIFYLPKNPFFIGEPVILVPKDVLQELPTARNREDIDRVVAKNESLRRSISQMIGKDWEKLHKTDLKNFLFDNPDIFKKLIEDYKKVTPNSYDFTNDPSGKANWLRIAEKFTREHELFLTQAESLESLIENVKKIIYQFKSLVEYNGLNKFLFKSNGKPMPEKAAQSLFNAICMIYCDANKISMAKECNAGRGAVDFKISNKNLSVLVEFKLSTNARLVHAYKKQIPTYEKSENSSSSFMVILKVKEKHTQLDNLLQLKAEDKKEGKKTPEIIVIDATPQRPASQA